MTNDDWNDGAARAFGMLIDVPGGEDDSRDVIMLALNGSHEPASFRLPPSPLGGGWRKLLDTSEGDEAGVGSIEAECEFALKDRSFVVFEAEVP